MALFSSSDLVFTNKLWVTAALLLVISSTILTAQAHYNEYENDHFGKNQYPKTRVTLFSTKRGHLRTVEDRVNRELVLALKPRHFEAYWFECNASYPVQWTYVGEGAPSVTAAVGRHFIDFYDIGTYTYQSVLMMSDLHSRQSGRYVCRGTEKGQSHLSVNYDLFVPGNGSEILLTTKDKTIPVAEGAEYAYIPCSVSDPTTTLSLFRKLYSGTYQQLEIGTSVQFKPRKGFRVKLANFHEPYGTYVCIARNKQKRKIHVVRERYYQKDVIGQKRPLQITYERRQNRILCCSGSSYVPKLQHLYCSSMLDCEIKSACFNEDTCDDSITRRELNGWSTDVTHVPTGCVAHRLRLESDSGLLQCTAPGTSLYQPYLLNRGNIFLSFEKYPPTERIMSLQRLTPEPTFVGSKIEFVCNSTTFHFGFGIRWGFQRLRTKVEFINDTDVDDYYPLTMNKRRSKITIPDSSVIGIVCYAPIANSPTEWRTVSLPVLVQEKYGSGSGGFEPYPFKSLNSHYTEPSDYSEIYSDRHDHITHLGSDEPHIIKHHQEHNHPHLDEYYSYHVDKEVEHPTSTYLSQKPHASHRDDTREQDIYTTLSVEFSPVPPSKEDKREYSYLLKNHGSNLQVNYEAAREASKYNPPIADIYSKFPRIQETEKARDFSTLRELSHGPAKDPLFGPMREALYEAPYSPPEREKLYSSPHGVPYAEPNLSSYGIHDHSKELELEKLNYSPPRVSTLHKPLKTSIPAPFDKYVSHPKSHPPSSLYSHEHKHSNMPLKSIYKSEAPFNSEVIYPGADAPPHTPKYSGAPRENTFPEERAYAPPNTQYSRPPKPNYKDAHARTPSYVDTPRFPNERPPPRKHFRFENGPPKFPSETSSYFPENPRMTHGPPPSYHSRRPEPNFNRREFNKRPSYDYRQGPPLSSYFPDYSLTKPREFYSSPLQTSLVAPPKSIKDVLLTKRMGIYPGTVENKRNQRANNALLLKRYTLSMLDNHNPPIIDLGFKK